jgi:hypothetical protein
MAKRTDKQLDERHAYINNEIDAPCMYCKHLLFIGQPDSEIEWTCKAFPEGIPYDIWARHTNHNQDIPGQKRHYVYESRTMDIGDKKMVVSFEGDWSEV